MPKIKIVAVSFNYDYATDEDIRTLSDALDWVEVDENDLVRIKQAFLHRHKVKDDPFREKSLMIFEEVAPARLDLWDLVTKCEEAGRKEDEAKQKRLERAEATKKKREETVLKRKKTMLAKLQKELEGTDNEST